MSDPISSVQRKRYSVVGPPVGHISAAARKYLSIPGIATVAAESWSLSDVCWTGGDRGDRTPRSQVAIGQGAIGPGAIGQGAIGQGAIGGDLNASCRPRVGYVDSEVTRGADARLQVWCQQAGLTCAAQVHATWQSIIESRYAVLDCFLWRSRTGQESPRAASPRQPDRPGEHTGR